MFLLVSHFDGEAAVLDERVRAACALLAEQPTCRGLRFARSTEEAAHAVLVAEFDTAADYRRALSPFAVRTTVIPWLSTARVTDSGVFEVLAAADGDGSLRLLEPTVPEPDR